MNVQPVDPKRPDFAGVISGVDLRQADAEIRAAIEKALDTYAVVVFHDQPFTDEEQIIFSEPFGYLEPSRGSIHPDHKHRFDNRLSDISNLKRGEGNVAQKVAPNDRRWLSSLANRMWHTDSSYKATPSKYSMLSARILPSWGGQTEFADMRAAYDALDEYTKAEIEDLVVLHSHIYSRGKLGFDDFAPNEVELNKPVPQALVRIHPGSKRKSLYLASHAGEIIGMPVPQARILLMDLTEHAIHREFVHRHEWKVGDFVIWDNRSVMHRGRKYDFINEARDMRRTTIGDTAPTLEQKKMMQGLVA
ncbi:MAG: TauD/TfdA dioxygenase family protein [Rhodospirillales bacterium]